MNRKNEITDCEEVEQIWIKIEKQLYKNAIRNNNWLISWLIERLIGNQPHKSNCEKGNWKMFEHWPN